ncbi:MAG: DUF4426 domain-containing protein [gamma proteobacterium symbiont of Bathyaustriella thionipta]|nr:DUF4426 domain-containing protein [gamma proteobacterium symbiont of Bathyaustriella thionipta]MCU7948553.1 DUF4426 domain-containing protein [gamma proteobacterium symbiont of Bathyaustriella thionipta]MCU7954488.1 DUF4426 domain-containing protein [gamma proteobacterium symbiont of Bathyaustriella thionipta]MCU7955169.1 DUF4426 domain-containing protein [gamma proteobacterium symbiont of Bathyaustriella thionipta]MCU7966030.1 DUF4426 domain-containing protein [gamma proteobacterium symbion
MKNLKNTLILSIALFFLAIGAVSQAENAKEYADHIVYYNAFPTDSLPPQMTKQYGLKRSKNYAMINISVMEKGTGVPTGVKSAVTGQLKNLIGQTRALEFREIKEGQAVYYIAQIGVQSKEVVNFSIDIKPEGGTEKYEIKFSKKF